MTQQDSGLRISTARGTEDPDKDPGEEQPGSEAFYSPSASQDASPASESALSFLPFGHVASTFALWHATSKPKHSHVMLLAYVSSQQHLLIPATASSNIKIHFHSM